MTCCPPPTPRTADAPCVRWIAFWTWSWTHPAPDLTLLLVVPTPPLNAQGRWDQLTPFFAAGPGFAPDRRRHAHVRHDADTRPHRRPRLRAHRAGHPARPVPIQMTGAPVVRRTCHPPMRPGPSATPGPADAAQPGRAGPAVLGHRPDRPRPHLPLPRSVPDGPDDARHRLCRLAPYAMRLLAAWPLALLLAPLFHPATRRPLPAAHRRPHRLVSPASPRPRPSFPSRPWC